MEFLHSKNDASRPVDSIRVNWFYRPKDIGRKAQDTRMLFATMHSDICPLNSLRGKCTVMHKAEIPNAEAYRRIPDCFWWDKMYDRYIQKNYDAIPTSQIINVPERVKKVLDERWKYILVEQGRGKDLTSAVKSCKRCSGYCAKYVPRPNSQAVGGQSHHSHPAPNPNSFLTLLFPFPGSPCLATGSPRAVSQASRPQRAPKKTQVSLPFPAGRHMNPR